MDSKTIERAVAFKQRHGDREGLADELLPDLKKVADDNEMIWLIGPPDAISWHYTLFYSSAMRIEFNSDSQVRRISSDVMQNGKQETVTKKQLDELERITAASEFQSQPYNRQKAAEKLIPYIKAGMTSRQVEDMLGKPDSTSWYYILSSKTDVNLVIVFNPAGKFTDAQIVAR